MHLHPRIKHHAHRLHHHFRLTLLIIPLLLMAGYIGYRLWAPKPVTKPLNVILISIDSLRPDHMSTYGYARKTTPHIDAWAKDAVVFDNYFSTSYLTPISEVSVHTGKYPFTTGVVNFETALATETPRLAQILKDNGWQTAAFGSSAEFSGYESGASLAKGFDTYNLALSSSDVFNGRGKNSAVMSLPWIKKAEKDNKPFFLWLSLGSAHWPYGQSEQNHFSSSTYQGYFNNISTDTWNLVDYVSDNKVWGRRVRGGRLSGTSDLTQNDFDYVIGRYDDGIYMTDNRLGQLLDYLKTSGLEKNTLVILESEHGEGLNERGYIMHYDIHDEQVHTPLIIKAPGLPAQKFSALTSGVDVLPTILSILKLPQIETDGVNVLPYITGTPGAPRDEVYITRTALWERVMATMHYEDLDGFLAADNKEHFADTAIRTKDWKLIHRRARSALSRWGWFNHFRPQPLVSPEYELYDLNNDPGERVNIYEASKTNPSVIYLIEHLSDWENKQFKNPQPETTVNEMQPYF